MLDMKKLPAYELVKQQHLEALNSEGYVLKHVKTGARICLLSNDDENKVFQIGFRTPPNTDTGVPHIIEHTVLCGSDKYPLKDPFVELIKGSLNTFINAMTFNDKTIYPVASCNDKDFQNLMDVYLDAVFHPNIYKYEEIFMQEGWHYEMESESDPLTINGVVYNEMKGAYSSPEEVLGEELSKALFPDTCYGKDSGGDPQFIPTLTREAFLDFHRAYYHPCNSYIYLYGDMDMEEKLDYIDKQYLSTFEPRKIDSEIALQTPFKETKTVTKKYSISSEESEDKKSIFCYGTVTEGSLDRELYVAMEVLNYALLASPGAVLKQALLDNGIGNEISSNWETAVRQPYFSLEVKNVNPDQFDSFKKVMRDTLSDVVKKGIDKSVLEAALNTMEFKYRESDFGSFPKGLMYVIGSMDSWLYDDSDPFMFIEILDVYASLKEKVKTDYFEKLISKYFLENPHSAYVILEPEKGLAGAKDEALSQELAEKKAAMSKEEVTAIVEATKRLRAYQEAPDTPEQLATIPKLRRSDIKKEPLEINNTVYKPESIPVVHHDMFTNGIHYVNLLFDVKKLSNELLPALGVLQFVWGLMDTKNYTFAELSKEIDLATGGIGCSFGFYENIKTPAQFDLKFTIGAKTFYHKMDRAMELIAEIIEGTKFEDEKRLKELISENRSRMQGDISAAGNRYGILRAQSHHTRMGAVKDMIMGIGFYQYLANLDDHFEEEKEKLIANLKTLNEIVFRKENLIVSSTCLKEEYEELPGQLKELCHHLSHEDYAFSPDEPSYEAKNEGFTNSSQVQYVCRSSNFRDAGFNYTGAMMLLQPILSYDYLWNNIRVKGGAYGCSAAVQKNGNILFTTYRDPHIKRSLDVFEGVADFLENFEADEEEMTKYVIGTFGMVDTPLTPAQKGVRDTGLYLRKIGMEELARDRRQALNVTTEDIHEIGHILRESLKESCYCVIGNEENIKKASDLFDQIETIK
ncbi:hypothetical protein SAMN02910358_00669 [Lachnospiraceae bacterium XBB1006]|nr:hypothetical protein SAMN02910358_00669 [Lachnospiraceae bacterium XBB1006]